MRRRACHWAWWLFWYLFWRFIMYHCVWKRIRRKYQGLSMYGRLPWWLSMWQLGLRCDYNHYHHDDHYNYYNHYNHHDDHDDHYNHDHYNHDYNHYNNYHNHDNYHYNNNDNRSNSRSSNSHPFHQPFTISKIIQNWFEWQFDSNGIYFRTKYRSISLMFTHLSWWNAHFWRKSHTKPDFGKFTDRFMNPWAQGWLKFSENWLLQHEKNRFAEVQNDSWWLWNICPRGKW